MSENQHVDSGDGNLRNKKFRKTFLEQTSLFVQLRLFLDIVAQ